MTTTGKPTLTAYDFFKLREWLMEDSQMVITEKLWWVGRTKPDRGFRWSESLIVGGGGNNTGDEIHAPDDFRRLLWAMTQFNPLADFDYKVAWLEAILNELDEWMPDYRERFPKKFEQWDRAEKP